jgi:hypothetical protein
MLFLFFLIEKETPIKESVKIEEVIKKIKNNI